MNPDEDGDFFILNCRWLRYRNKVLNDDEQHYLWSRIGNKIDMKRKGGSNGNKLDLKTLFSAISISVKSPRMGHAEFWLLKERKIILVYMSSDTAVREVKHFHYSFPKHEGQIVISRRFYKNAPIVISEMLKMTAIIKYLTPHVIWDLNQKLYQNGGWAAL